jgi:hypothetical protein
MGLINTHQPLMLSPIGRAKLPMFSSLSRSFLDLNYCLRLFKNIVYHRG